MSWARIECATRGSPGGRLVWREYTTFRKAFFLHFIKKKAKNPIALFNWGRGPAKGGPGRRLYVGPRHATLCFLHAHPAPQVPPYRATRPSDSNPTPFTGSVSGRYPSSLKIKRDRMQTTTKRYNTVVFSTRVQTQKVEHKGWNKKKSSSQRLNGVTDP